MCSILKRDLMPNNAPKWDVCCEITANVEEFDRMTDGLMIRYTDGREVPYRDVVKGFAFLGQNDSIVKTILRAAVDATGDENIMVIAIIYDPGNKPWNESLIQRPEGM